MAPSRRSLPEADQGSKKGAPKAKMTVNTFGFFGLRVSNPEYDTWLWVSVFILVACLNSCCLKSVASWEENREEFDRVTVMVAVFHIVAWNLWKDLGEGTDFVLLQNKSSPNPVDWCGDYFICLQFCASNIWDEFSQAVLMLVSLWSHRAAVIWWLEGDRSF